MRAVAGARLGRPSPLRRVAETVLPVPVAVVAGLAVAVLVTRGHWYLVVAMLLAPPAFVVIHRYPIAVVMAWLFVVPFVGETSSATVRKIFWLFHRGLPPLAVAAIVLSAMLGLRAARLPRLGWAEAMMGAYAVATMISIAYTSPDPGTATYAFYDWVFIPMCLYLIVRLVEPGERDLRWFLPLAVFIVLTQSALGIVSWKAPGMLPAEWLGKLGERTTGSLRAPEVFATTLIFCGVLILHVGMTTVSWGRRLAALLMFGLVLLMVFLSFSRSAWLAALVALAGTLNVYRGFIKYIVLIFVPLTLLVLGSGTLTEQTEFARQRFRSEQSEESALSRLPVVYASLRMFEARPLVGWGYLNFDRYDRQFQATVGNLVAPDKDHSSHNLFLTTLAEQGAAGFVLFVGPFVYWGIRSRKGKRGLPRSGLISRRLLGALWLSFAGFVIVNNFYRMQTGFALGMWWIVAGLIASLVARGLRDAEDAAVPTEGRTA